MYRAHVKLQGGGKVGKRAASDGSGEKVIGRQGREAVGKKEVVYSCISTNGKRIGGLKESNTAVPGLKRTVRTYLEVLGIFHMQVAASLE